MINIPAADGQRYRFPGASSLIIDLAVPAVRYCVSKSIDNASTRKRTAEFLAQSRNDPCMHSFQPDPSRPLPRFTNFQKRRSFPPGGY
jgi:hypothetical protein